MLGMASTDGLARCSAKSTALNVRSIASRASLLVGPGPFASVVVARPSHRSALGVSAARFFVVAECGSAQ
jgi:hypothetical protein